MYILSGSWFAWDYLLYIFGAEAFFLLELCLSLSYYIILYLTSFLQKRIQSYIGIFRSYNRWSIYLLGRFQVSIILIFQKVYNVTDLIATGMLEL